MIDRAIAEMVQHVDEMCRAGKWTALDQFMTEFPYGDAPIHDIVALLRTPYMARNNLPRYADNVVRASIALRSRGEDADGILKGLPRSGL